MLLLHEPEQSLLPTASTTYIPPSTLDLILDEIAWYRENSNDTIHPVAQKEPNNYGLYDMLGNVWEFCEDKHAQYDPNPVEDPLVTIGSEPVSRGGSYVNYSFRVRSAIRATAPPDWSGNSWQGFRLVLHYGQ